MSLRSLLCGAAVVLACGAAAVPAGAGGGPGGPKFGYGPNVRYARPVAFCKAFSPHPARERACLIDQLLRLVVRSHDPAHELPRIDRFVHGEGGFLESNCHIMMHTVGRRYGRIAKVTLGRLRDYLPRTNDSGCSAGFAHGLITYLGPQIVGLGPAGVAAECDRAPTRYQRYSCIHGLGHAYMRLFDETFDPALAACRALGPENAPDCAQGAFHDYWIALSGLDSTRRPAGAKTSPRAVCGSQQAEFVRPCWYRAYLERPPAHAVSTPRALLALCRGLDPLQHSGCVTGASLITSPDPFAQLALCGPLSPVDADSCVRGVRVPGVAGSPIGYQVRLIQGCASFQLRAQRGCYEWLGKALAVVTNGTFATRGCPRLAYAATRASCRRGAASYEGPLETFS